MRPIHQPSEHPPERLKRRLVPRVKPLGHLGKHLVQLGADISGWGSVEVVCWGAKKMSMPQPYQAIAKPR
jgi:hypothetical protein